MLYYPVTSEKCLKVLSRWKFCYKLSRVQIEFQEIRARNDYTCFSLFAIYEEKKTFKYAKKMTTNDKTFIYEKHWPFGRRLSLLIYDDGKFCFFHHWQAT
jgi:hypothetical protein